MGLEVLTAADMVLNACGRPVPPAGFRFVDLPRIIPFHVAFAGGSSTVAPQAMRVENTSPTLFLARGMTVVGTTRFNIKWPNGRELSQNLSPSPLVNDICFPTGGGSAMLAFSAEQPVESGARVSFLLDDSLASSIDVQLWGVLRYLLKVGPDGRAYAGDHTCIVGYPAWARSPSPGILDTDLMVDPIQALADRQRYRCGPNQNILCPEWLLGNQLGHETPAGYRDEAFTFLSSPFSIQATGTQSRSYNNSILLPGDGDIIIRRVRPIVTWAANTTGSLCFSLRLPNGYSVTGGDLIPASITTSGNPSTFAWLPMFPTLTVFSGDRLIVDIATLDGATLVPGSLISVTFEFDALKRRRIQ